MAMSDSESTQVWEEDENDLQSSEAFSEALASLEEQLQEQDDAGLYDETEQEAVMYEEGVNYEPELDASGEPEESSFAEHIEHLEDADDFEAHVADMEAVDEDVQETATQENASFEDYPAYEESAEEVVYEEEAVYDEAIAEDDAFAEEASTSAETSEAEDSSPLAASLLSAEGADDFNLATLTQLVDEIRQESQRVSEMKSSVAKALSLIQEMSESLKS